MHTWSQNMFSTQTFIFAALPWIKVNSCKKFLTQKSNEEQCRWRPHSALWRVWNELGDTGDFGFSFYAASLIIPAQILTLCIQSVEQTLLRYPSIIKQHWFATENKTLRCKSEVQNKQNATRKRSKSPNFTTGHCGVQRCRSLLKWSSSVAFTRVLLCVLEECLYLCVHRLDSSSASVENLGAWSGFKFSPLRCILQQN